MQKKCKQSAKQVQGKCTTRITGQTKCTTLSPARPAKRQLVHDPLGLQRHLEQQPTRTLEQFSREQVDQEQNTCQSHPKKRHYTISAAARCVDIQSSLLDCVDIQSSCENSFKLSVCQQFNVFILGSIATKVPRTGCEQTTKDTRMGKNDFALFLHFYKGLRKPRLEETPSPVL